MTDNKETIGQPDDQEKQISLLNKQLRNITDMLERVRFQDYIEQANNPKKMLYRSFISGVSRGLGMAVGFTVLGALLIQLLTMLANNNIPIISRFIADIVKTVENYL